MSDWSSPITVLLAVRAVWYVGARMQGQPAQPTTATSPSRLWSLFVMACRGFAWVVALVCVIFGADASAPWWAGGAHWAPALEYLEVVGPLVLALSPLLFTPTFLKVCVVPLRFVSWTYRIARTLPPFGVEPAANAAIFASLSLARRWLDDPTIGHWGRWLERKVDREPGPKRAGLVAYACIRDAAGSRDDARRLFELACALPQHSSTLWSRRIAVDWLVADALTRGEISSIARWHPRRRGDPRWASFSASIRAARGVSRWAASLASIAAATVAMPDAPSPFWLRLRWLMAPGRRATLPLLRRALEPLAPTSFAPSDAPAGAPHGPLEEALRLHRAVLGMSAQTGRPQSDARVEAIARAASAWDRAAASSELQVSTARRALAVGRVGDSALEAIMADATADLVAVARETRGPIAALFDAGAIGIGCAQTIRDGLFSELQFAMSALERRRAEGRMLAPIDDWLELARLHEIHQRAVDRLGPDARLPLFLSVYVPTLNHAVWLWNEHQRRGFGGAVCAWLLTHARAAEADDAVALLTRNVAAAV